MPPPKKAKKIESGKDLIMLLLYAKGHKGDQYESIKGRTRLMKMVFLFDKEVKQKFNVGSVKIENLPEFSPYNFGPFSEKVYEDLDFLNDLEFVKISKAADTKSDEEVLEDFEYCRKYDEDDECNIDENVEEFCLTRRGIGFVESGRAGKLTDDEWHIIDEFKSRCTGASLKSLLYYVYKKYPEMTTKSEIKDEVLSRRF